MKFHLDRICMRKKSFCTLIKELAFRCEGELIIIPEKKIHTKFLLQRLDRIGDRRLSHKKLLGSLGNIVIPGRYTKVF